MTSRIRTPLAALIMALSIASCVAMVGAAEFAAGNAGPDRATRLVEAGHGGGFEWTPPSHG